MGMFIPWRSGRDGDLVYRLDDANSARVQARRRPDGFHWGIRRDGRIYAVLHGQEPTFEAAKAQAEKAWRMTDEILSRTQWCVCPECGGRIRFRLPEDGSEEEAQ